MIDWSFIEGREGHSLTGYVPDAKHSQSGVTVATGVDLGQMSQATINGLPFALRQAVQPYIGLKGVTALDFLKSHPLTLSKDDADLLDRVQRANMLAPLSAMFQKATDRRFELLPDAVQTVIMSVQYQYGSIWVRCPAFWKMCVTMDYPGMVKELINFGDHYQPRRTLEANYLKQHWPATGGAIS